MLSKCLLLLGNGGLTFWAILLLLKRTVNPFPISIGILLAFACICFAVNVMGFVYYLFSAYQQYRRYLRHKQGKITNPAIQKIRSSLHTESRTVTIPIK